MKRSCFLLGLVLIVARLAHCEQDPTSPVTRVPPTGKDSPLAREPISYREVVRQVLPSVVSLEAKTIEREPDSNVAPPPRDEFQPYFDRPLRQRHVPGGVSLGFGSGVIIDSRGVVLTSFHVVDGARILDVHTHDGRRYRASEIRADRHSDLAIVRFAPRAPLQAIEWADSDTIEMGDPVLAFGAPFGLRGSVSRGIVSAKGRTLRSMTYEDYIQTDAAVNPGSSGGPLVNLEGKLVGVLTAIKSRSGGFQGVGLAVSSNLARRIAKELIREGRVRRGHLGVIVEDLDPDEHEKWDRAGVSVTQVISGSPAARAGLRPGDVLLRLNDRRVESSRDLQRGISELPPNTKVTLDVIREGRRFQVELVTTQLPDETLGEPARR
jgi:serine protease Do